MNKKQIKVNDIIFEKVKFRYAFIDGARVNERKMIGKILSDTLYPLEVAKVMASQNRPRVARRTGFAISERISQDLQLPKLHISELTTMLGYTKTDITKLLQTVKNKQLMIKLIGLGGTGSNFLHWMYEMSSWVGKMNVFESVIGYDDDIFDVPNMLRIPFIPEARTSEITAFKTDNIPMRFQYISAATMSFRNQRMVKADMEKAKKTTTAGKRTIIYGAPDIGTRQELFEADCHFFAATHRDNEYSIVYKPEVDNDLMMETYGKINLSMFFLNHLSMTIDFLKHLAAEDFELTPANPTNVEVVREDFALKYVDQFVNGFKAGSKRFFVVTNPAYEYNLELPQRN